MSSASPKAQTPRPASAGVTKKTPTTGSASPRSSSAGGKKSSSSKSPSPKGTTTTSSTAATRKGRSTSGGPKKKKTTSKSKSPSAGSGAVKKKKSASPGAKKSASRGRSPGGTATPKKKKTTQSKSPSKSPSPGKKTPSGKKTTTGGRGKTPSTLKKRKGGLTGSPKSPRGNDSVMSFGKGESGVLRLYGEIAQSKQEPNALFTCGWMYYFGMGGATVNYKRAIPYFISAAQQKHDLANYHLAEAHFHGNGVNKSVKAAMQYYEVADALGVGLASLKLGRIYAHGWKGEGVTVVKDLEKGKIYLEKAVQLGNETAKEVLASLS